MVDDDPVEEMEIEEEERVRILNRQMDNSNAQTESWLRIIKTIIVNV